MTKRNQIWKCEICGNIIEILHEGADSLVCCNQPMILQKENSEGEYAEKHAPVVEKNEEGVEVKIGNIPHPMEPEHYIEWIEISTENANSKKFLNPEIDKEAKKNFPIKKQIKKARMYCNKHGLWVSKEK